MLAFLPTALSATWSILVVDLATGRMVIASATCVPLARFREFGAAGLMDAQAVVIPGIGIAAAQAAVDPTRANQRLIARELRAGAEPSRIIARLREDPAFESRQFAILDTRGRSAGSTGSDNGAVALDRQGQIPGAQIHYSVQGNILASNDVVLASIGALMSTGDVLERVMTAMEAADAAGGDRRCTCGSEPISATRCDRKTAHVAYLLATDPSDAEGSPFLYLDVTDENVGTDEDANPVRTLRMRFDAWRATQRP